MGARSVALAVVVAVAWAWLTFLAVYCMAGLVAHLATGRDWPPARLIRVVPGATWFATLMFAVTLVLTSPAWAALVATRRWLGMRACVALGVLLYASAGEWFIYRMEWFDVWRHGNPGWRYWLTVIVPVALAWGAAGAVLGSAIGRPRRAPQAA